MSPPLNRRQVLAGAAAIGTGVAVGSTGLGLAAQAAPQTFDVVVVGAGAAGMTAALTAGQARPALVVVEKAPTFGGSAARSGAGIWIPNNEVILAAGVPDTPAKAATYLAAVVGDDVPADRQQAFLANGPAMISFVMATARCGSAGWRATPTTTRSCPAACRTAAPIEPDQLDGNILGAELASLNPPYIPTPAGMVVFSADYKWLEPGRGQRQGRGRRRRVRGRAAPRPRCAARSR